MLKYKIISLCFLGLVYSQCEDYSQSQCNNNEVCEWIYDISYGNCGNLTVGQCYNYPGECYVDSLPGWYDSSGPYCTGGTYQIDNSYCEEIEMPECSDMNESECSSDDVCEWVEDIEIGQCSQFDNSENSCTDYPSECFWDEDITYASCDYPNSGSCNSVEGCYWDCSDYGWYCDCYGQQQIVDTECIGQYEIDNSYCEESINDQPTDCTYLNENTCNHPLYGYGCEWVDGECQEINEEELECDIYNESECIINNNCEWIENQVECEDLITESNCNSYDCDWNLDTQWANCDDLGSSACDDNPNCWGAYQNPGWYYGWYCAGGWYEIDNSYCDGESGYCEEILYLLGDINQDTIINIQDVIIVVNFVLENQQESIADLNSDHNVNVLDVIVLVNIILNN